MHRAPTFNYRNADKISLTISARPATDATLNIPLKATRYWGRVTYVYAAVATVLSSTIHARGAEVYSRA